MSKRIVLTEYDCPSPKLNQPIVSAQVSDLHARPADDILASLRQVKPDLIAVTGDTLERYDLEATPHHKMQRNVLRRVFLFVAYAVNDLNMRLFSGSNKPDDKNAFAFLEAAVQIAPVVMSLGNHERKLTQEDEAFLREIGVVLLDNADTAVTVRGNLLKIGGLSTAADEAWLARFAQKDGYKLLLCHHPEYFDTMLSDKEIDLTLAGHNHGGQIRIGGHGLLSAGGGLLPKYDKGFYHGRMIVSAGCSNTVAMPRICNPRELVLAVCHCCQGAFG